MKIRTHNLLITLPIFAALGLAAALLYRNVQQRELRWGLEERARGIVISLTAFIGDALAEGLEAGATVTRLARVTARGAELSLFTNLVVHAFRPDGSAETRFQWPAGASGFAEAREMRRMLGDAEFVLPPLCEIAGVLCQPAIGLVSGGTDMVLGVAMPVPGYPDDLAGIDRYALLLFLFALVSGLLLVLLPARFLAGGLKRLGGAPAGDGTTRRPLVREFADLDQSLEAMVAIRDATVSRARRGLVEHEQYRRIDDLVTTLFEAGQPDTVVSAGRLRGEVRRLGAPQPGHFMHLFPFADGLVLCRGRIVCSEPLAAVEQAAAAAALVPSLLATGKPADVRGGVSGLFSLEDWCLVVVSGEGKVIRHDDRSKAVQKQILEPDAALVLASVNLEDAFLARLAGLADGEVFAVLQAGLAGRRSGMVAGLVRMHAVEEHV